VLRKKKKEVTMSLGQIIILVVAVLIGLVVLAPIIGFTIWLALTLLVAGLIGWLADRIVPGELPYGKAGAVGAGIVGAVVGSLIPGISGMGPELFNIRVVPAFVGALIVVALVEFFASRRRTTGYYK
jgi:uncharacterized membrane protein YeaQ/YmgE (transglycosylase-associated protein family)